MFVVGGTTHTVEDEIEAARHLLAMILPDEDWDTNEHLENTPKRFVKMLREMTHSEEFEFTSFINELEVNEMVIVRDIPFYTFCAHHIIPFFGVCHVAYIPEKWICGISKLPRMVTTTAKGLWVQEKLTDMIAFRLNEELQPQGLGVVMEAEHMCMTMRGVQLPGTKTITSSMQGVFLDPTKKARDEFLSLIRSRGVS
jgi:GTP cyclohydrolase I